MDESKRQKQVCSHRIPASRHLFQTLWVHPFYFHYNNINRHSRHPSKLPFVLQHLISDLNILNFVPAKEKTEIVIKSFRENLGILLVCLFKLIENPDYLPLALKCINAAFELSAQSLEDDDKEEGTIALKTFSDTLIVHGLCSKTPGTSKIVCDHILEIIPEQVLRRPQPQKLYMTIFTNILKVVQRYNKANHSALSELLVLNRLQEDSKASMNVFKVQPDGEKGLLWNQFSNDFDSSSFMLSQELFRDINALSNGDLSGKKAHNVALEVTQKLDMCLKESISVVENRIKEEKLLVKTHQMTVICAIIELMIMDSNFPLLLLGLNSFAKLIGTIIEAEPKEVSERDFNALLVNQSGDGYCWIFHLATNFLRVALSDPKQLIRVAGSQVVTMLLRLPAGPRSLVRDFAAPILGGYNDDLAIFDTANSRLRKEAIDAVTTTLLLSTASEVNFYEIVDTVIVPGLRDSNHMVRNAAVDCLAVAKKLGGETLIARAESQLSLINRTYSNKWDKKKKKKGEEEAEEAASTNQTAASLHSIVFQRRPPSLDSQARLTRPSRRDSIVKLSDMEQVKYETSSSIHERRKPSAGRMHGNLRLPWDPRDSVVAVGSANGGPGHSAISIPNLAQSANFTMNYDLCDARTKGHSRRRSISNQNVSNRSPELHRRSEIRRSLDLSGDRCYRENRASGLRVGASYEDSNIGLMSAFSGSRTNILSASMTSTRGNSKVNTTDTPEGPQIRRRASHRRAVHTHNELDLTNLRLSDQLDAETPPNHRPITRCNGGGNPFLLTAPSISSGLATGRASLPQHHSTVKVDLVKGPIKNSNSSIDSHNPHLRPLKGQHVIAQNMMLPRLDSDSNDASMDVVGRSMHLDGDDADVPAHQDDQDLGRISGCENGNDISGRTTVLERLPVESPEHENQDDDITLRTGTEGLVAPGFGRRSSRSLHPRNMKSNPSQRERKRNYEDGSLGRNDPQTPTRTQPSRRPPHGSATRRPPTGQRDGSLQRRPSYTPLHDLHLTRLESYIYSENVLRMSITQRSPDSATKEAAFSRLSRNPTSASDTTTCRDVRTALNCIASQDWEDKVNGLLSISTIALKYPTAFSNTSDICSVVIHAVIVECRNLRSQVSRQAVKTLSDLFRSLGRLLDPYVDTCVRVLLTKTGEASAAFLRGEVAIALSDLIRSVSPNRVIMALFQHGLSHKNAAVRRQCAIQASYLIESLGAGWVLQGASHRGALSSWGSMTTVCPSAASALNSSAPVVTASSTSSQAITESVIVGLGKFLLDSNQETRYYGRRILATLQQNPDFERVLTRYLSGQMLRAVREATKYLHTKGLGEPPTGVASASCPRTTVTNEKVEAALQNRGCSAGGLGGL